MDGGSTGSRWSRRAPQSPEQPDLPQPSQEPEPTGPLRLPGEPRLRGEEPPNWIVEGWWRCVIKLFRVRRLQRYFGHLGQYLQRYSKKFRQSLQREFPKIKAGRR